MTFSAVPGTDFGSATLQDGQRGSTDIAWLTLNFTMTLGENWTYEQPSGRGYVTQSFQNGNPQGTLTIASSSTATNFAFKGIRIADFVGQTLTITG